MWSDASKLLAKILGRQLKNAKTLAYTQVFYMTYRYKQEYIRGTSDRIALNINTFNAAFATEQKKILKLNCDIILIL